MDDLSADITPASTVIDDAASPSASGAGAPRSLADEPSSLRDTIAATMKEQIAEADKADAKEAPKDEPEKIEAKDEKPAVKEDDANKVGEKPAEKDKADDQPKADDKVKEEQQRQERDDKRPRHPEPPQRFLPRAKELWPNVPNEVKAEVARITREHDDEVKQAREFITPLVKYHQMAQQSGTTIHEALDRYVNMETSLRQNPTEGFKALLSNMGLQPHQAISHIIKAFDVRPEQLAQHMGQNPQAYTAQDVPQQPKEDPRVSQLQQQLAQEQASRVRDTVIEPFKAEHPRYDELEQDIAFFLGSGKIPANLSHHERLEAAYDMAARINPASNVQPPKPQDGLVTDARAVSDLGGTKSIKSAPGSITPDMEPERGGSIRDILADEVRRRRIA